MRFRFTRCLGVLAMHAVLSLCTLGCQPRQDSGPAALRTADFGSGLVLGQSESDARATAERAPASSSVLVLSGDELTALNLHAIRRSDKDLILGILRDGKIHELRCFPADNSAVELLDRPLRNLELDTALALFGNSASQRAGQHDSHLEYRFPAGEEDFAVKLVLSFQPGKGCYAAMISLDNPPAHRR